MNKLVYWVGVYTICVAIHDFPNALHRAAKTLDELAREHKQGTEKSRSHRKEEIGIRLNNDGKPMNKIGFFIESE